MSDEKDIPAELIDLNQNPNVLNEHDEEDTVSFKIAEWVMQEFDPGFVIIGSPDMQMAPSGLMYPNSIGVLMNDQCGVTKTMLANILLELAHQLGNDMQKIESFLKEALGNDNDGE